MFLFSKKDIIKKVILASLSICLVAAAIVTAIYHIQKQVIASTAAGDSIVVNYTRDIYYGERDNGEPYRTRDFTVSVGDQTVTAFCANPERKAVKGTFPTKTMQDTDINKRIKLMIYIATANNDVTNPIMDSFFSGVNDSDLRYAYSHAVIGALYANDYHALTTSEEAMIRAIYDIRNGHVYTDRLGDYINENNDVWLMAKNYQLYNINRSGTTFDGNSYQDIVWIEDNNQYGNIRVEKHDSETESTTPQGGANLKDINFKVYNNSGSRIYNPKTQQGFYDNGELVAEGSTNENGVVEFDNLVLGSYKIEENSEGSTNNSYNFTATSPQYITLSTNGETKTVVFNNTVKRGSLTVYKNDKELDSCNKLGKADFTGIKFQIINRSTNPIVYNGNTIAVNDIVAEETLGDAECSATFDNLPYGDYNIVEDVSGGSGYLAATSVDVTIQNTTSSSVTFKNQVIRGNVKFKKVDQNNQPMANVPFRITSETTNESHIVITDANGVVDTSANPHSNHTNGYDIFDNFNGATYQGYGTWFGESASSSSDIDSLGALPYDTYKITEVSCDQNRFCNDIELTERNFDITEDGAVRELGNWINNCAEFSLTTTATDNADDDKYVTAGSGSKIKDTISYCLKANTQFTIIGTLIDKQAKNSNEQVIGQSTITVSPTADCGVAEMIFEFDASSLAGHEVVVYESVYYNNVEIVAHANSEDESQTVSIISLATTATDNADGDKYVTAGSGSKIKDTINYCLKANTQFTIIGTLIDKQANNINEREIGQSTITVSPTADCGVAEMIFEFDASSLAGHEVVVYESVYYNDVEIVAHANSEDESQTVSIISLATTAVDGQVIEKPEADNDETENDDDENEEGNDSENENEEEDDEDESTLDNEVAAKYVENTKDAKIKDTIAYCLKTDVEFTIIGTLWDKTAKEELIIDGQVIEKSITVKPTKSCGEVEMVFELDASLLGGHEIVVFEKLYYNQDLIMKHEEPEDEAQTVRIISLTTFATHAESDSKDIIASGRVRIKDEVKYCLKPNTEYTFKGTLMNKNTGKKLLIDGKPITQTVTFTTEDDCCGQFDMFYEFDATDLGGTDVVIFEDLYEGDDLIIRHSDPENQDETFYLTIPVPDTGFATLVVEKSDQKNPPVLTIAISVCVATMVIYLGIRFRTRKKYFTAEF
ncbi:VaFE repeat-containing surface-anchored protein [Candidatus Saccharibacteria bacterium]|nr:VaFE repeat-containing surface-anchored protein [Candidatus Saccharibacteria bacterium]